jgi:hypothetical protein
MERGIIRLIVSLLIINFLVSLHCDMTDPTDPSRTRITAVFKNAESRIFGNSIVDTVGKPLSIGAALYLPVNFDSISLVIKEDDVVIVDTTFKTFDDAYYYDTVWYTRTFSSEGIKNVTFTSFSTPSLQPLSINIPIVAKTGAPVHITFVKNSSSSTGSMPVQTYISGKTVKLPENTFVNPGFNFSGWATSATGSVEYRNKDEITLGIEDLLLFAIWVEQNSIAPAVVHAPSQVIAGKADTLLFAVDNSTRPDPLTISLLTDPPLDPAIFSIVPTGRDSIKIAIAPSAHSASASIGIITSNGTKSDTSRYPITLVNPETALWNTTSLNLNTIEGSLFILDLSPYLSTANSEGISLSSDVGTIDKKTWSFTPKWGCAEKQSATITAKKSDVSLTLSLNLTVAAGDTTKPQLNLVDGSLDGKKVSSSQISVDCKATDAGAGVDSVVFTCGAQKVSGTLQGEDVYRGVITGLVQKTPSQITITVIDKSRKENRATLTFTVTWDSTILDAEPPMIGKTSGPESCTRVKSAKDGLTFTVNDNAGVDSVWWTLNDIFVAAVSPSNEKKYTLDYSLSQFGKNVIILYAKDGSSAGNKGSQTITLNYNTEPTAITLTTPAANATGISTSPTFKWSGGDDTDGDGITFTVNYGMSQTGLSNTATVAGNTATISSPLTYAKTYYWQVTAKSSSTDYPDEVKSTIGTFTTEGSLPSISVQPKAQSADMGQNVTFSVTASGFGTISYQWRENGKVIDGATKNSYTISQVTTNMNNNTYDCVVKNEVGDVTSDAAKLTVVPKYKVTYNENYGARFVPVDSTLYSSGDQVTVKAADTRMVKDGYKFKGWCLDYYGKGTILNAGDQFKIGAKDTVLFAQWEEIFYTVTLNYNDGTGTTQSTQVKAGGTVNVTGLTRTGYTFKNWSTSKNTNSPVGQITANTTVYAWWEVIKITITLLSEDLTFGTNGKIVLTVNYGDPITIPWNAEHPGNPWSASGGSYAGWNINGFDGEFIGSSLPVAAKNMTYYAPCVTCP